jgi:hypothetical protein
MRRNGIPGTTSMPPWSKEVACGVDPAGALVRARRPTRHSRPGLGPRCPPRRRLPSHRGWRDARLHVRARPSRRTEAAMNAYAMPRGGRSYNDAVLQRLRVVRTPHEPRIADLGVDGHARHSAWQLANLCIRSGGEAPANGSPAARPRRREIHSWSPPHGVTRGPKSQCLDAALDRPQRPWFLVLSLPPAEGELA